MSWVLAIHPHPSGQNPRRKINFAIHFVKEFSLQENKRKSIHQLTLRMRLRFALQTSAHIAQVYAFGVLYTCATSHTQERWSKSLAHARWRNPPVSDFAFWPMDVIAKSQKLFDTF